MSLTVCRNCGASVAAGAALCPACGTLAPDAAHKRRADRLFYGCLGAILAVGVAVGVLVGWAYLRGAP